MIISPGQVKTMPDSKAQRVLMEAASTFAVSRQNYINNNVHLPLAYQ